jgi:predicted glycosyltransferase
MLVDSAERKLASTVASLVHSHDLISAAREVSDYCRLSIRIEKENTAMELLQHYLHHLLNSGAPEEAAAMLWTKNQFTSEPQFTKDLWNLFETANTGLIMGAAS